MKVVNAFQDKANENYTSGICPRALANEDYPKEHMLDLWCNEAEEEFVFPFQYEERSGRKKLVHKPIRNRNKHDISMCASTKSTNNGNIIRYSELMPCRPCSGNILLILLFLVNPILYIY